jgi:hypothetical protein
MPLGLISADHTPEASSLPHLSPSPLPNYPDLTPTSRAGTSAGAHRLERGKSERSQATVEQPLVDIDVVHQQLLEDAPKIGQIAP